MLQERKKDESLTLGYLARKINVLKSIAASCQYTNHVSREGAASKVICIFTNVFVWSIPVGVMLKRMATLLSFTHRRLSCESLLSGNQFRPRLQVNIGPLCKCMKTHRNYVPWGSRSAPFALKINYKFMYSL